MASYDQNVNTPINTLEYQKFVTLGGTEYPAITSVRTTTLDNGTTYSLSSIFPKTAILSYLTNPEDIKISLSAENLNMNLADVEDILNVISPNVDSINTNVGTINTNVADIETLATTINTGVDSINTNVGIINTNVNDIETLIVSTNTLVNAVTAKLDQQLGQAGVVVIDGTSSAFGTFTTFQTLTTTKIAAITATNSSGTSVITNYELLQGYSFSAPIQGITLSYGAALLYK